MRNKWWKPMHGTYGTKQWASRIHPDFLFVCVVRNGFYSRIGNPYFNLTGTAGPKLIHRAKTEKEAIQYALKWIKRNSGRDYCQKATDRAKADGIT